MIHCRPPLECGHAKELDRIVPGFCARIRRSWTAGTSNAPKDWSMMNPALGQCAVTALVVQDLFGGELVRGGFSLGSHYWNVISIGLSVDLTLGQFEEVPHFDSIEVRSREYVLSFPDTRYRYRLLLRSYFDQS